MTFLKNPTLLPVSLFLAILAQILVSRTGESWVLAAGIFIYIVSGFLFIFGISRKKNSSALPKHPPLKIETLLFFSIGAMVLFFRLYKIVQIPQGLTPEETCGPWIGFSTPPSQWKLFDPRNFAMTYFDIPFLSYGWFHLFEPSHLSFSLFYVLFTCLSFPLIYWFFRDLAGPRVALLTLFIWAMMQWQVTLSRSGHASVTSAFYVMAVLVFVRQGWKLGHYFFWILAGGFCGLGFYAHPSFRAVLPLLALALVFEWSLDRGKARTRLIGIILFTVVFLVISWPYWQSMWQQHWIIGSSYDHLFVGKTILEEKSLTPLWRNFSRTWLAFFHMGSPYTQEGLPGRRLLDDATGVLFVLGFFLGLCRWREKKYFYGIAGLAVLSLPCVLSTDPYHTSRMLGAAPFIAYLAANAAFEIWERVSFSREARRGILVLGLAAAAAGFVENYKTYFMDRPLNEACWREGCVDFTQTGQEIADLGGGYEYYLSPVFFGQFTVLFLGHTQLGHLHSLDLPDSFCSIVPPPGRGLFFALQEGRTGVLRILKDLYPGGVEEKRLDPWGRPYLYFFRVPASALGANEGLRSLSPIIQNLPFPEGLPFKSTQVHLTGSFWVERSGIYRYRLEGKGKVKALGECPWVSGAPLFLARGFHPLDFILQSQGGLDQLEIGESFTRGAYRHLATDRFIPHVFPRGWLGTYRIHPGGEPVLIQDDPVLNFSYRDDFPLKNIPAFQVEWRGTLHPSQTGLYHFLMLATDHMDADLVVDGKKAADINREAEIFLSGKDHPAVIRLNKEGGFAAAFHLLWKRPGQEAYEVIPPEALR